MLQDFYMLELYFGTPESAQSFEDLVKKYGSGAVIKNLTDGLLVRKSLCCPDSKNENWLVWLSEKGRELAFKQLSIQKT